jgi:hypothetical protein
MVEVKRNLTRIRPASEGIERSEEANLWDYTEDVEERRAWKNKLMGGRGRGIQPIRGPIKRVSGSDVPPPPPSPPGENESGLT